MGLLHVSKVECGNTNDGNTSRSRYVFQVTVINMDFINRMRVVLEVISSGNNIDVEKVDGSAYKTTKQYVELYE